MAIRFENQRQLLEYLGKNPNDRSLVQRMERRGEVYREDGGYYLNEERAETKVEQKSELEGLCNKLRQRNEMLEKRCKELTEAQGQDLYYHLKFFYEKFVEWKKFVDGKAFGQANHNNATRWTQDTMEMVIPEVYARYNFSYWDVEKSECEFVEQLIKERLDSWLELPF